MTPHWPDQIDLPVGFHPGGAAVDESNIAYFGSLTGGALFQVDLSTGLGSELRPGINPGVFSPETMAVGLAVVPGHRLVVCGGWGQQARLYDLATGDLLATFAAGDPAVAIYGVTVHRRIAWFTDGFAAHLYQLPVDDADFCWDSDTALARLPLVGEWVQGPSNTPTASGLVVAPDGRSMIVANLGCPGGALFQVDPESGFCKKIEGSDGQVGECLGLVRKECQLFLMRHDGIAVMEIDPTGSVVRPVRLITSEKFDGPTAGFVASGRLYSMNSHSPRPPEPGTSYQIHAVHIGNQERKGEPE